MARQSASVYRRRRLVVLVALLLALALIGVGVWALIARPWDGAASGEPAPTAAAPAPAEAQSTPSVTEKKSEDEGIAPCGKGDVTVTATTDADTYASDQSPRFSIALKNNTAKDCTINVGSSTQTFTVRSGDDVWWRSTDCQKEPSDMVVTLAAGQQVSSKDPVTWDRTRSSTETCDSDARPVAPGGDASYHLSVGIGGFESVDSKQFILN